MTLPSNAEIFKAIAEVMQCRDSRRGRKPAICLTVLTQENGITIVCDHNTGCESVIGKRHYKKRSAKKVSPIDGLPIVKRSYKRKESPTLATAGPEEIAEAAKLCGELDKVEERENNALGDAYRLYDILKAQRAVICESTDENDRKECVQLIKKMNQVSMVIKGLGGDAK